MEVDYLIDYYTGTGGAQHVAEQLTERFTALGKRSTIRRITRNEITPQTLNNVGYYILVFSVHAFNAPKVVHEWLQSLSSENTPAAIISISGAGETLTNTACRRRTKKLLKKRGFDFHYENMVQMPNNWIAVPKNKRLFQIMNQLSPKIEEIFNDIIHQKKKKNKTYWSDILLSALSINEQKVTPKFGEKIEVTNACIQCGICVNNCCSSNITFHEDKVAFAQQCDMCLGCIYNCPQKALKATYAAFQIAKNGYNLKQMLQEHSSK